MKTKLAHLAGWRLEPSSVTAIKEAYRTASRRQRQTLRAWFLRVLTNTDATP